MTNWRMRISNKQVVENSSRGDFKLTKFQNNNEELSENIEEKEASILVLG